MLFLNSRKVSDTEKAYQQEDHRPVGVFSLFLSLCFSFAFFKGNWKDDIIASIQVFLDTFRERQMPKKPQKQKHQTQKTFSYLCKIFMFNISIAEELAVKFWKSGEKNIPYILL